MIAAMRRSSNSEAGHPTIRPDTANGSTSQSQPCQNRPISGGPLGGLRGRVEHIRTKRAKLPLAAFRQCIVLTDLAYGLLGNPKKTSEFNVSLDS